MKVSLIVAIYKDLEALNLIIEALKTQSYKNFELIIAEDCQEKQSKDFIAKIKDLDIKHTYQEDKGIRKSRSINNAILKSTGEYLIFIDGDCIPFKDFIKAHVLLAQEGYVLSGRRVNLGEKTSKALRKGKTSLLKLQKPFMLLRNIFDKGASHTEQGLSFKPNGFIYKNFMKNKKRNLSILGCNYSCFKKDMLAINGYDESYEGTAVGDDTDLQWRFKKLGLKLKSCKMLANVFHLYHNRKHREVDASREIKLMQERKEKGIYICEKGLNTH